MTVQKNELEPRLVADMDFLRIFLPPEIHLAQRQSMVQSSISSDGTSQSCLGFYLVRLEAASGNGFPAAADGGSLIGDHIQALLNTVIRDSDIPVRLSDWEHLVILRDLNPDQTYVVSQRFLSSASDSDLLRAADLTTRVGYVIYPLSSQPNYAPDQWENLIELARTMSSYGNPTERATGRGLVRGPNVTTTGVPESDLIPVAIRDLDALVKVGLVTILKIHLMSSV
jgi:hypothetical protein